jgi:hypothetical protein
VLIYEVYLGLLGSFRAEVRAERNDDKATYRRLEGRPQLASHIMPTGSTPTTDPQPHRPQTKRLTSRDALRLHV